MASAVGFYSNGAASQGGGGGKVPPPPPFPPPADGQLPPDVPPPPSVPPPPQDPVPDPRADNRKRHEEDKRKRDKAEQERRRAKEAEARKAAQLKQQKQLQQQQQQHKQQQQHQKQQPSLLDNRLHRDTPFQATIRFKNDLPEIPGDPKMIVPSLQADRLAAFKLTTLEREPKRELPTSADLGIPVSLLDIERYAVPASGSAPLDPADKALLAGEDEKFSLINPSANPRHQPRAIVNTEVSWLMRTTYISHDLDTVRKPGYSEKQAKSIRMAAKVGEGDNMDNYGGDRASQIAAIEASFEAAKRPPVHAKNPELKAVEVLPVFPDFENWSNKWVQAHFDNDPTEEVEQLSKLPQERRRAVAARCMLKGFKLDTAKKDDSQAPNQPPPQEKFMALVVPSNNAAEETSPSVLEGDYMWSREYGYDLQRLDTGGDGAAAGQPGLGKQEFFIRFADGQASYCDIFARLELRKRGELAEKRGEAVQFARPSKVIITRRDATDAELDEKARKIRRLYGEMEE